VAQLDNDGHGKPRKLADFDAEIDKMDNACQDAIAAIVRRAPTELALIVQQADWHLQGLYYHLRRIRLLYEPAIKNVADMAAGDPHANILVTRAPEMLELIFEFYAFMSLARITLDQLQRYAAPALNIKKSQIPNSISDVLKWESDFPVYRSLTTTHRPLVRYLLDIRDCIVHHRTFAASDGLLAVEEGFPEEKVPDMAPLWFRPVVRTYFRRLGGIKVSVNISLPDAIYNYSPNGERGQMLTTFAYGKVNILSQCRAFAELCTWAVLTTLTHAVVGQQYVLRKPTRAKQVRFSKR
jgi:hypothetical protein